MEFLTTYLREASLVEANQHVTGCRDPRDDKFLALAVSGRATHIVSGDADLLSLHPFRGIPILPPSEFIKVTR